MSAETTTPDEGSALDIQATFERANPFMEPPDWKAPMDFDSNLEAAMFWARAGFDVRPSTWPRDVWLTRPEDLAVAWGGTHAHDAVVTRAPRGTVALAMPADDDSLTRQGPTLTWSDRAPHAWESNWRGPRMLPTFTLSGFAGFVVRLWTTPPGFEQPANAHGHHLPNTLSLSTQWQRVPFGLPCPSSNVVATGSLQPLPRHLEVMLSAGPLPCREQDVKGYHCPECAQHNNNRPTDLLDEKRRQYLGRAA